MIGSSHFVSRFCYILFEYRHTMRYPRLHVFLKHQTSFSKSVETSGRHRPSPRKISFLALAMMSRGGFESNSQSNWFKNRTKCVTHIYTFSVGLKSSFFILIPGAFIIRLSPHKIIISGQKIHFGVSCDACTDYNLPVRLVDPRRCPVSSQNGPKHGESVSSHYYRLTYNN